MGRRSRGGGGRRATRGEGRGDGRPHQQPRVAAVEGVVIPLALRKLKGILEDNTKAEMYQDPLRSSLKGMDADPLRSNFKGMDADVAVERLISQRMTPKVEALELIKKKQF